MCWLPWSHLAAVAPVALAASTVSAVSGFGGAAVLLPALVITFGVRDAVPILTIAQLAGNGARVWFNREEIDWRVVGWFALGSIPMAALGGAMFAIAPRDLLTRGLGAFLLGVVAFRRLRRGSTRAFATPWFAAIGSIASFLSALLGSVGPLMAPFFLAFGLLKGAYIGTEAMATVVMHATKLCAYGHASALSSGATLIGLALAPAMIAGSYLGKRVMDRLPARAFATLIEAVLVAAGIMFVVRGG